MKLQSIPILAIIPLGALAGLVFADLWCQLFAMPLVAHLSRDYTAGLGLTLAFRTLGDTTATVSGACLAAQLRGGLGRITLLCGVMAIACLFVQEQYPSRVGSDLLIALPYSSLIQLYQWEVRVVGGSTIIALCVLTRVLFDLRAYSVENRPEKSSGRCNR